MSRFFRFNVGKSSSKSIRLVTFSYPRSGRNECEATASGVIENASSCAAVNGSSKWTYCLDFRGGERGESTRRGLGAVRPIGSPGCFTSMFRLMPATGFNSMSYNHDASRGDHSMPIGRFMTWLIVIDTLCRFTLAILNQSPLELAEPLQGTLYLV